jgi:hypothetical protein
LAGVAGSDEFNDRLAKQLSNIDLSDAGKVCIVLSKVKRLISNDFRISSQNLGKKTCTETHLLHLKYEIKSKICKIRNGGACERVQKPMALKRSCTSRAGL